MKFGALARHADRLTEACNKVALLLVANTPFYPLYLWFILGHAFRPMLLLTALSLPFFAASLWLARRNGMAGRVWLCACASLNTAWVAWLLGAGSGVALFFLPCLILAVLAFRAAEFWARALLTAMPGVLYLAMIWLPRGPVLIPQTADGSLLKLNGLSVALLCVILPYLLGTARASEQN